MKRKSFGGNGAVGCQLGAVSAPDEKVGERLKKQQEKAKETNK